MGLGNLDINLEEKYTGSYGKLAISLALDDPSLLLAEEEPENECLDLVYYIYIYDRPYTHMGSTCCEGAFHKSIS